MRNKKRNKQLLRHDFYPLEMLKILIEGQLVKGKNKVNMYNFVQDYLVEYVR
jgi:hypothetical protein